MSDTDLHDDPAPLATREPDGPAEPGEPPSFEVLLDVPVTVSVEIGRTSLSLKEILELTRGSIVSLGKLAGEPMDLLVNGKKIAQGEIVIVDESFGLRDSFGIRITKMLAGPERGRLLG